MPDSAPEISIVVVSYNMERELPRTLLSLSPDYQRNCPAGRCEIIVVDNGSDNPPTPEAFAALGLDLSIHIRPEPAPSPVEAVNFGLAQARAPLVAVWIDGARLASPGLIDACAQAAKFHSRSIIATANYHLGPAEQYVSIEQGYDAAEEDRLLNSIDWPAGADRLFEIASPVWYSGDLEPMLESNALFMPRAVWDEIGGYDVRFTGPGGGAANPDVFIRACALPDTQLIRIRGEATFHQIHGGAVSNAPGLAMQAVKQVSREYYRIRQTPLRPVRGGWIYDTASGELER